MTKPPAGWSRQRRKKEIRDAKQAERNAAAKLREKEAARRYQIEKRHDAMRDEQEEIMSKQAATVLAALHDFVTGKATISFVKRSSAETAVRFNPATKDDDHVCI